MARKLLVTPDRIVRKAKQESKRLGMTLTSFYNLSITKNLRDMQKRSKNGRR